VRANGRRIGGTLWQGAAVVLGMLAPIGGAMSQQLGDRFQRVSQKSNFEFAVVNFGLMWGDHFSNAVVANWPRGKIGLSPYTSIGGPLVVGKRGSRFLASDAGFIRTSQTGFHHMVPGRLGDPNAGFDPDFNGVGWKYVSSPDYIVYSSLDYDSSGVDESGANFFDWPLRLVDGRVAYVTDQNGRGNHPAAFRSDEDMFLVFKDTDTRADPIYAGPSGPSVPMGLEVQQTIFSWFEPPGRDIVLLAYRLINKGGALLDSCYFVYGAGFSMGNHGIGNPEDVFVPKRIWTDTLDAWRNLSIVQPINPEFWGRTWLASPIPPTIGFSFLKTPSGYNSSAEIGLSFAAVDNEVNWFVDENDQERFIQDYLASDSVVYRAVTNPNFKYISNPSITRDWPYLDGPVIVTGPFPIDSNDSVDISLAIIFSDSLSHLLLLDDFITRVYDNNFARPVPPPTPQLTAVGLNRSVKLSWDNSAESATDIIIPDSLGRPFVGYRLLRATSREGPFVELAHWHTDTLLVYEYLDTGDDLSGKLKNNVTYYYQLLSYDEGAPRLKLDPMSSPAEDGVNAVSVIPTTEPSDATSESSDGSVLEGTLGDVTVPMLIPRNTTNFNRLLSGRDLTVQLTAASNGLRYTLPITITDSISGRVHNDVIDPDLLVHGSPDIAGVKTATATIEDVFGIGAADITFDYSFEQLSEPFHIVPSIEGGSDCPIILSDSLGVTGLQLSSPYTSAAQQLILEFSPGGIDTISTIFQRYVPYLRVQLIDASTGGDYTGSWTFKPSGVRRTGGPSFNPPVGTKYYLTGMLSNGEEWDFGHLLTVYNWAVAFDLADHGVGSGKPSPTFSWASQGMAGTVDFAAGDRVTLSWEGGVRAVFPDGTIRLTGAPAGRTDVTEEMMEGIRVVPNPYFIRHEAQRANPELYFNYLPEECTIRIYTLALDLVKTLQHTQGSREVWDLTTEGGQLVASQMLIAHIEATNGMETVKKFAVVVGK